MYQALYRKYRPMDFKGVIGQEHIVKTLKNEILSDMVSHAYLFCGTRGTGKTSTAKIFAKAINCMSPVDGEPCGKCEMCRSIQEGRSVNVIEIDAASNTGVENIRNIRDEVKYPPTEGRFKVYIIDEVHMLSTEAFNAFLKTLEEPPEHVIFILATTDPQKVPVTILSRCQRFDFKRITSAQIASTLKKYLAKEGAQADDEALLTVARLGDGSMRDSLSILDQCLAFYHGENITEERVLRVSGTVDNTVLFEMTDAIFSKDAVKAMDIVDRVVSDGREVKQFVMDFISHLRNLLVTVSVDEPEALIDLSAENIERFKKQGKRTSPEEVIFLIKVFSQLSSDMKYSSNQRIMLEVELIKLAANTVRSDTDYLAARLAEIERKIKNGIAINNTSAAKKPAKKAAPKPKKKAVPEDIKTVIDEWKKLSTSFEEPYVKAIMSNTEAAYEDDERLTIVTDDGASIDIVKSKMDIIKDVLSKKFERDFEIKVIGKNEYEEWQRYMNAAEYEEEDEENYSEIGGMFDPDILEFK